MSSSSPGRRRDIDGLRAVAIALVLVFHCFPAALPGGFVGVDVFFVISGYLITAGLVNEMAHDRFSVRLFYARRGRRLLPALFLVLAVTALMALLILFEPERRALGKHMLSALRFGSNFTLMKEQGYFDAASNLKPLLHLWSLAVEEQFYVLFPALLWCGRRSSRGLVTVMAILSILVNAYLWWGNSPQLFYNPLARFWEILVGSALAWIAAPSGRWRDGATLVGLGLVMVATLLNADDQSYPGPAAVPVVLGAALVIWGGARGSIGPRLLGASIPVFIGAISYPLYLWHWPLLAYARFEFGDPLPAAVAWGVLTMSLVLATLTYAGLEVPLRRANWRVQWWAIGVGGLCVYLLGWTFTHRLRDLNPYPESLVRRPFEVPTTGECDIQVGAQDDAASCVRDARGTATRVVWGDSKADALFPALLKRGSPGQRWAIFQRRYCAPALGVRLGTANADDAKSCARWNQMVLDRITGDASISKVLLVLADRVLFRPAYVEAEAPTRSADVADGLFRTIEHFLVAGKQVSFLLDNPTLQTANLCLPRPLEILPARTRLECTKSRAQYQADMKNSYRLAERLRARFPSVIIIDPVEQLCPGGTCAVIRGGQSLYSYTDHLSDYGADLVAERVLAALDTPNPNGGARKPSAVGQ